MMIRGVKVCRANRNSTISKESRVKKRKAGTETISKELKPRKDDVKMKALASVDDSRSAGVYGLELTKCALV